MSHRALRPVRRALVPLVLLVGVGLLAVALPLPLPSARAADPPKVGYRPPVDAPVTDPFRPPEHRYGPGNRGLEYGTDEGAEVRAAADGTVVFAGVVAGTRHVTLEHADGLRTTVSYLDEVAVVVHQRVRAGDRLGTAAGHVHFGVRSGDSYLDPAALFAGGPPAVRLVPFDEPPGNGPEGERSAILQLLNVGAGVIKAAIETAPGTVALDWVAEHGGEHARLAVEYATDHIPIVADALDVVALVEAGADAVEQATRACTPADEWVGPPPQRRIALLIGGLGSTSEQASVDDVDTFGLGYQPDDVLRFSYAGGRTPDSPGRPPGVAATSYEPVDTLRDLRESGRLLADLVQDVARSMPGIPIDLIAHSQGGLVARLALEELVRRGGAEAVALLATIATPHGGSDLATAARLVGLSPSGAALLREGGELLAGLDPTSTAVRQLSETSDLIEELASTDLPPGLPAVSIAARLDLVVPVPRTELDGATQVVVPVGGPTAHSTVPGDHRTTRELALALAGRPPGCRSALEAVRDQAVGAGISMIEDEVAPYLAGAAAVIP